jgi:hypothetical protein
MNKLGLFGVNLAIISSLSLGLCGCGCEEADENMPIEQNTTVPTDQNTTVPTDQNTTVPTDQNTTEVFNYSTVTSSITGKIWMDRNLGASRACLSQDDKECYGDYYQWGRDADGHEKPNSPTTLIVFTSTTTDNNNFVISAFDWTDADESGAIRSANWNVCPTGFRIPTINELLDEKVPNNILNLPLSGNRTKDGYLIQEGNNGYLLSSTPEAPIFSKIFRYNDVYSAYNIADRTVGAPIRCIKE